MLKELTEEQILKILNKLPEDLKGAFFSVETAEKIREACEKYEIPAKKITFIASYVGQVLLGVLSPDELEKTLEKEAGLKKDIAQGVSQQIYRYIFFPVKESLAALSGAAKIETPKPTTSVPSTPSAPPSPSKPDIYRETAI